MSNRKLTILGIVAVLMVIWAVLQSRISNRPKTEPDKPAYLIQGLEPADIGSIILGTSENVVTLKRQRGRFVVADKGNYPATASEINELITSCLDIRTAELYTSDKANHKDLGVTEEDARSVVKFLKPDSSLLTGVVIGKNREQGRGSYVRLASSDKVYVTSEAPRIRNGAMDYIDEELITISRDDIESVTVASDDGDYTLRKKEQSIILENLPEGKKLKGSDYEQVFNALTNMRFNDVQKKSAVEDDLNFQRQFVCRLKDSSVYTIDIAQKNDKTYVTCEAEFMDKTPVTKEKGVESEEELKKKEAKLLARDKVKEFSDKHKGWVYEIAEYMAKNLTKKLSELVEDEEKPKQAEQQASSSDSAEIEQ
jgi:hypothetical protein